MGTGQSVQFTKLAKIVQQLGFPNKEDENIGQYEIHVLKMKYEIKKQQSNTDYNLLK